jgi:fructose-specific phosphotransferase system IIA component
MRLSDIIDPDCIRVPLEATDKQNAIYELIDLLAEQGKITDKEMVHEAVWQRESTRTTGIGHGLAIPHGKCDCCDGLTMAIGKPPEPIDFQSIDGKPVRLIILLISPVDQTGPHIQALATVSRMMTDSSFRAAITNAQTADEVYRLIEEHDKTTAAQT